MYTVGYQNKRVYYQSRSLFNTKTAPAFTMTDREQGGSLSFYSALTSFPMYAKYGNLNSVREIPIERVMILMKDPKNLNDA
jgi:hypothetical protein